MKLKRIANRRAERRIKPEHYDEKYLVYEDDLDDPNRPEVQNICTCPEEWS